MRDDLGIHPALAGLRILPFVWMDESHRSNPMRVQVRRELFEGLVSQVDGYWVLWGKDRVFVLPD